MYDLDEVRPFVLQWEEGVHKAIEECLGCLGNEEDLLLQQMCGWPLISNFDKSQFVVVAVPKYETVEGCQGHLYTSMIVVGVTN